MKISKIRIENFRSIESADIDCTDFNVFVGRNNAGKTNVFEAVDWLYKGGGKGQGGEIHRDRNPRNEILVEVTFTGALHGARNMRNEGNRTKMVELLGDHDVITVLRRSNEPSKRTVIVGGQERDKLPTGFDKAFNDFLPEFEFVHTRQYFDDVAKYGAKTPVGIMLGSVFEQILLDNPQYKSFREKFDELFTSEESAVRVEFDKLGHAVKGHLERQFAECSKVSFEVTSPDFQDLLKTFRTTVDDGVETYADEKGDGMQRALMLAIIQAFADYRKAREHAGKSFLFFIDEAELHLHPMAQRQLKGVPLELSTSHDQVFVNTHSSVFIADGHPAQSINMVEKMNLRTTVAPVSIAEKPYVVFELLGGSPTDLLLPANFVIVEGKSEVEFLTRVIRRHYQDRPRLHLLAAEGDSHQARRSWNAVKKAYSPLQHSLYEARAIILCDKPTAEAQTGFDRFVQEFESLSKRGQIHVLGVGNLEEAYCGEWRRTSEQVADMDGGAKVRLAKEAGEGVSQEQFEREMPEVAEVLYCAWKYAT